jgi:hypothetical protein
VRIEVVLDGLGAVIVEMADDWSRTDVEEFAGDTLTALVAASAADRDHERSTRPTPARIGFAAGDGARLELSNDDPDPYEMGHVIR